MRNRTKLAVQALVASAPILLMAVSADAQMTREQALRECREQYAGGPSRPSGAPNPAYAHMSTEQRQALIRDCVLKLTGSPDNKKN